MLAVPLRTRCSAARCCFSEIFTALLLAVTLAACSGEGKKSRLLDRADRYFKAGEYDKAKIEYMNLLRVDNQNAIAFQQLGLIWTEEGAPLRAAPFLVRTRELAPNNLDNRLRLARALMSIGRLADASSEAMAILQQSSANGGALAILVDAARTPEEIGRAEEQLQKFPERDTSSFQLASANMALRKGDRSAAEGALQRALALEPKSPSAHFLMAAYWLSQKNAGKAREELKIAAELAPPRSIERLKFADFEMQRGAMDEAAAFLKTITIKAPDYLPAWKLLGQIAFAQKKYDESLSLLENVLNRDPENSDANMLRAQVWLAKGEKQKAIEALQRLDNRYPNFPPVKYELARAYLESNNPTQASAALNQAIAVNPEYAEAVLLLGQLNLRSGDPQATVTAMVGLLKKRPELGPAQFLLADAYTALGRMEDAAAIFREQIKVFPQNAQAYTALGVILRQQKKTDEARRAFEKATELAPNNSIPIAQLIDLDISTKQFENAIQRVQQQLEKNPDSALAHFLEGRIYAAQGKWDLAETALTKTLSLDANFSNAYSVLASTYVATNKLPQAASQLETLLSKTPDNRRALMTLGLIYEKMHDFPKARDAYEKLISLTPEFAPALNNLAVLYAEHLNELEKADKLAQKARKLQPTDASIADTSGWIFYKKGDYQQAVTLLQESAAKAPNEPQIQYHLGMARYMMGQKEAARTAFQQAANSTTDFPDREEAQRRLGLMTNDSAASKGLSIDELETFLRQQPNDIVVRMRLGEAYENQQAFDKAGAAYEEVLKLNPRLLPAAMKLAQLNAGALHNSSKALEFGKKARDIAPADPQAAALLGRIAYQAGNFTWAYSLLQESARQLGKDPEVLHDYSWAAYSLGKASEAQQNMEQAAKLVPDSPQSADAKTFLAMTALDQDPKAAISAEPEIQKILRADPKYVPALMAQAAIQVQRGETKPATGIYNQVLRQFPDFAPAQKRLAAMYVDDPENSAKAYDLATKARKVLPDDPDLAKILGEISYDRKEYPRAIQLLQESARKQPLDAKSLYYLGMSCLQAKQKSQAREALDRALAAGLQDPLAAEARHTITELQQD